MNPETPRLFCSGRFAELQDERAAGRELGRNENFRSNWGRRDDRESLEAMVTVVMPSLSQGKIGVVLHDYQSEPIPVHLVHAEQTLIPLKMRRFMEFGASRLRKSLAVDLAKLEAPVRAAAKKN
jgi:hypothetical protein